MRIGKPLAILVGAFTISPIGFMLFAVTTAIPQIRHQLAYPAHDGKLYEFLSSSVNTLTIVWLLLLAFYVLHLFGSPLRGRDARIRWVLAFVVFGPLAELVYWWRYVWPHKSAATLSV